MQCNAAPSPSPGPYYIVYMLSRRITRILPVSGCKRGAVPHRQSIIHGPTKEFLLWPTAKDGKGVKCPRALMLMVIRVHAYMMVSSD